MFICNECGKTFEEPKVYYESHPYGEGHAHEKWTVCPYCREADISEAEQCERCGDWVESTRKGLCDVCYEDMFYE